MQRGTSCELCFLPLAQCPCYSKPSQLSDPPLSLTMQPETYCNLCLSPLALCPCYSKLSQRITSADFATSEIGTIDRLVVASPPYQHLMPDFLLELGEGDMISPNGLRGHLQPLMLPTGPTVSGVGTAGHSPLVASPAQVSAANRRGVSPPYHHLMPDLLEFGEGDMIGPNGLRGHLQTLPLPTDPTIYGIGTARQPPQPVAASPAEVSAANRRSGASPPYQHLTLDSRLSFYNTVAVALPSTVPEFGEGDMINPIRLRGRWQPLLLPTDPIISGVGAPGQPPQPVVASPAHVNATNRRRTSPRRFACRLCPQDFTAKHNLRNHMNSHLKKKDHKCSSCGKSFTTKSSLNRHSKKCRANTGSLAA